MTSTRAAPIVFAGPNGLPPLVASPALNDIYNRLGEALTHADLAKVALNEVEAGAEDLQDATETWLSIGIISRGERLGRLASLLEHHLAQLRTLVSDIRDDLPEPEVAA